MTYLTDLGGPTLILNNIGTKNAKEELSLTADEIIISRPLLGKHIKFDGRLLHAAPCDLLEEDAGDDDEDEDDEEEEDEDEDENEGDSEENDSESDSADSTSKSIIPSVPLHSSNSSSGNKNNSESKKEGAADGGPNELDNVEDNDKSGGENEDDDQDDDDSNDEDDDAAFPKRITFLVNIWLNHIPIQSKIFPANRLERMQKFPGSSPLSSSGFLLGRNSVTGSGWDGAALSSDKSSDKKVIVEEPSSAHVPSIAIESTIETRPQLLSKSNDVVVEDSQYQDRKWRFSNSGVKYEVSVPLPPFNRLQALNIDYDAFRLLYRSSGKSVKIKSMSSNKRKALDSLSRDSST